jgi:hypothetical protein
MTVNERVRQKVAERIAKVNENIQLSVADKAKKIAEIKKESVREEDARRVALGEMTQDEKSRWHKMSKVEKKAITERQKKNKENAPHLKKKFEAEDRTPEEKKQLGEQWAKEDAANRPTKRQLAERKGERYISAYERLNPHLFKDGQRILTEPSLLEGHPAFYQNIPTRSDEEMDAAEEFLQQYRNELPGLLQQLGQSPETGMSKGLQSMFGHMQNPILQGFLNPGASQGSQVLFPSQIAQQSGGNDLQSILAQLAMQGAPQAFQYASENAPAAYDYLQQNIPAAYNYAAESRPGQFVQGLPGNIMNILSGLGNRFRGNQ